MYYDSKKVINPKWCKRIIRETSSTAIWKPAWLIKGETVWNESKCQWWTHGGRTFIGDLRKLLVSTIERKVHFIEWPFLVCRFPMQTIYDYHTDQKFYAYKKSRRTVSSITVLAGEMTLHANKQTYLVQKHESICWPSEHVYRLENSYHKESILIYAHAREKLWI